MRSLGISLAFALFLVVLIPVAESAQKGGLAARVAQLEAQVAVMEEILQFVYVETEPINNLAGPHWIIEGANVHVRSGSGETADGCPSVPSEPGLCQSLTGLGNLIVGYNEERSVRGFPEIRVGSHNLIVGIQQAYWSFGGFVAGAGNRVTGPVASVLGGTSNIASGLGSSVSGGQGNVASGVKSSVSGGQGRSAENDLNWAAGSLFEEN